MLLEFTESLLLPPQPARNHRLQDKSARPRRDSDLCRNELTVAEIFNNGDLRQQETIFGPRAAKPSSALPPHERMLLVWSRFTLPAKSSRSTSVVSSSRATIPQNPIESTSSTISTAPICFFNSATIAGLP